LRKCHQTTQNGLDPFSPAHLLYPLDHSILMQSSSTHFSNVVLTKQKSRNHCLLSNISALLIVEHAQSLRLFNNQISHKFCILEHSKVKKYGFSNITIDFLYALYPLFSRNACKYLFFQFLASTSAYADQALLSIHLITKRILPSFMIILRLFRLVAMCNHQR
jgi:hypothetical protein